MMKKKAQNCLYLQPVEIHMTTVRAFITHHCQTFSWACTALGAVRAKDFAALLDLATKISDELIRAVSGASGPATEYGTRELYALGLQFVALVGKYQYPEGSVQGLDPKARAKQDFLLDERRNKRLNTLFRAHSNRGTARHWAFPLVRRFFWRVLGETPFYERIFDKCDFSGGASIGHSGTTTHLAAKLGGEILQGEEAALTYFELALWRLPDYRDQFLKNKNGITCVDREEFIAAVRDRFKVCGYNKLEVVAKNAKSGRIIAKEPEIHNFLQTGIGSEIRDLLLTRLRIDLRDQGANQKRARHGALLWEEPDCDVTLDVKSASNGVLTEVIRYCAPPQWFKLMDDCRSKSYSLDGEVLPYEMFCSMGNGFCFPLETLLFAAIVDAAHRHAGLRPDYKVYGDDIVVRRPIALLVIECLRAFGFRLNLQKSYVHGMFKESCGANSYGGQEVTPGYYKEPVSTRNELYAQHNSLASWPKVQAEMRTFLPVKAQHMVPCASRYRWVTDQAFVVPLDVAMCSPRVYWDRHLQGWYGTVLTSQPQADTRWRGQFKGSNPEQMVLTAVLRGAQSPAEPFHLKHTIKTREKRLNQSSDLLRSPQCSILSDLHDGHVVCHRLLEARKGTMYAHLRRPLMAAVKHYLPG